MKWMFRLGITVAVIWAAAWFLGAHLIRDAAGRWFAEQEARGLVAEHGGIAVQGFATRFDLVVTSPHLADTGFDWTAPFVQVKSMIWKPWHLIAALPSDQRLTVAGQVLTLETPAIEASLRMAPQAGFPPREAVLEWESLGVTSDRGWSLSTAKVLAAAQATPDQALRLWLQADDLTLPETSDPGGLGRVVQLLRLDARADLAAPLTWEAVQVSTLEVRALDLTWGSLRVSGEGRLVADAQGRAEGEVVLEITGWQALPDLAIDLGLIQPGLRGGLMGGLQGLADAGEDPLRLSLPLRFAGGAVSLGPIPLGPAPYLQ